MSTPSFDEILEKNKIIKGRLSFKKNDLEKLYLTLKKDNNSLKKKLVLQEEVIKSSINKRNEINYQIKRNTESVLKSFYTSRIKISLIYKKQNEFYYVKARFYWGGKQREVQVGSIPNVIEIINLMIINKLLFDIKIIKVKQLTWEQINNRPQLINALKEIASIKAQEYILRQLMNKKFTIMDKMDENIHHDKNINLESGQIRDSGIKYESLNDDEDESIEGIEWYEKWRRNNL